MLQQYRQRGVVDPDDRPASKGDRGCAAPEPCYPDFCWSCIDEVRFHERRVQPGNGRAYGSQRFDAGVQSRLSRRFCGWPEAAGCGNACCAIKRIGTDGSTPDSLRRRRTWKAPTLTLSNTAPLLKTIKCLPARSRASIFSPWHCHEENRFSQSVESMKPQSIAS